MNFVERNTFGMAAADSSNSKREPEIDGTSLKWEDFFGKGGSDDLLPCLMGVYDNIAGKEFEKASVMTDSDNDPRVAAVQNLEETIRELKRRSTMLEGMVDRKQLSRSDSLKLGRTRPRSLTSAASSSSLSSAVSSGRVSIGIGSTSCSSCCSSRSDLSSSAAIRHPCHHHHHHDHRLANTVLAANKQSKSCYLASEESLAEESPPPHETDNEQHHDATVASLIVPKIQHCGSGRLLSHTPKVTSGSQYSEDSGVFSSLQRSNSLEGPRSYSYEASLDYPTKVILEIVETEAVYMNDLQQIIEGYLEEWRNNPDSGLTSEQINDLFGNLEEIYDFNRCFLWELEQCGLNPIKIARCFVENNSNFSIYATYCTNYPRSVSVLTDLMRQEKTACIFRDRQISLQHTLPLGSYLLKPVQRILKYHLLLQNMVKHSPADSIGYNDITVALSTMTGIAHHINNMKRRHEHAVRVQEVQSLLVGWQGPDLAVFGELYAEGTFRISGARALRHIFLFEHMLLVTKKKDGGVLNYKTHIICSNLMLVECLPKEPLSFQIIPFDNPRLQLTVHARSVEEKRHWALEIKRVILENYNVEIPSHARQLVMELGQVQHLANNLSLNKIISKRQHSTPEYLERRRTDKHRKKTFRSHLAPFIKKSDLLGNKIQSKFKRNIRSHEDNLHSAVSVNSLDVDNENVVAMTRSDYRFNKDDKNTDDDSSNDKMEGSVTDASSFCCSSNKSANSKTVHRRSQSLDNESSTSSGGISTTSSYDKKEKAIEEIIGQLLLENKKFQLAIKNQRDDINQSSSMNDHSAAAEAADDETKRTERDIMAADSDNYDEMYENRLRGILKYVRRNGGSVISQRCYAAATTNNNNNNNDDSNRETSADDINDEVINVQNDRDNNDECRLDNLSCSLNTLIPNSPTVWLKQQDEHLASPSKKADSLPRTFQIINDDDWKSNRPKTIASDKPPCCHMMKLDDDNYHHHHRMTMMMNDGRHRQNECSRSCILLTKVAESSSDLSSATPRNSMHNLLHVHPECKFYRTSVTRLTLFKMLNNLSAKIANLKLQLEEQSSSIMAAEVQQQQQNQLFYRGEDETSRSTTTKLSSSTTSTSQPDIFYSSSTLLSSSYRQGSSKLGARIARCTELTDYADPRVLFPTITPSKKAASLLGIRPFTSPPYRNSMVEQCSTNNNININNNNGVNESKNNIVSSSNNDRTNNDVVDVNTFGDSIGRGDRSTDRMKEEDGSDCSADSYYEHKFEEMENLLTPTPESGRNSFLFDYDPISKISERQQSINDNNTTDEDEEEPPNNFVALYSHLTPNISIHKPIRIPPPIPIKPKTTIRLLPNTKRFTVVQLKRQIRSKQATTAADSSLLPARGWVRQVVDKIQATGEE